MDDAQVGHAAAGDAGLERINYPPVLWLSLLCLDAPIVALSWQWLFARSFGAPLGFSLRALLFFTAWLIYLGDRFADTLRLSGNAPLSLRHRFCRDHTIGWWIAVVLIFIIDTALALGTLDLQMFFLGGTLAAICAAYLFANHWLGGKWGPFPMKEKAIGVLFAAGTVFAVVAELPGLTISFGLAALLFAVLCTYNCLSIAFWERDLDAAQGKASLATHFPAVGRLLRPLGLLITAVALVLAVFWHFAAPLFLCMAASALLLIRLNSAAEIPRDQRTALADFVLLTPLVAVLFPWR